jgi:hypothetical protein
MECGSPAVEGKREDGVTTWTCPKCGSTTIDAAGAEWKGGTHQSNEVRLYTDGKEICAMIGKNPIEGITGYGASVHEACRDLADGLVRFGIWIEVNDPDHPWRGFHERKIE